MNANRTRCATSLACLLIAFPALADTDKKQQPAKRAVPQQMRQQSAQNPTLPAEGTRINTPGSGPRTGASGSVNTGKPVPPVGTQTIGGQQTGGAAVAGATVGTTTTSPQPKSGNTLVNPNAPGNQTGGAMPGDFSRDKKLQSAVDGGAGAVTKQATTSGPGQKSGTALIDGTQSNFESMRGDQGSRTSQQGMFPAAGTQSAPGSSTASVPSPGGAPMAIPYPVTTTAPATTPRESPPSKTTTSGDDAGTLKGMASSTNMGDAKYKTGTFDVKVDGAPITRMTTSGTVPAGATTPTQTKVAPLLTPSPDDGAGTPVPVSVQNLGGKGPSLEQTKKERGRQTTMPSDDKQQVDRIKADQRAASATMAGRRTNSINPGDQTTPSGGFSGTPTRGAQGGPSENSKGGSRPQCPQDNPTC